MALKGNTHTRIQKPRSRKQRAHDEKLKYESPHSRIFVKPPKELLAAPKQSWWATPEAQDRDEFSQIAKEQRERLKYGKFGLTPREYLTD